LKSSRDAIVPARGKKLMKTDLRIKLSAGCYGRIAPRTDLTLFYRTNIGVGVTDEDFCGNVSVLIYNRSEIPYTICRGDRTAHLICEKIYYPELDLVKNLDDTWRGAKGFG
jgi:dUTP pyrophosphatase